MVVRYLICVHAVLPVIQDVVCIITLNRPFKNAARSLCPATRAVLIDAFLTADKLCTTGVLSADAKSLSVLSTISPAASLTSTSSASTGAAAAAAATNPSQGAGSPFWRALTRDVTVDVLNTAANVLLVTVAAVTKQEYLTWYVCDRVCPAPETHADPKPVLLALVGSTSWSLACYGCWCDCTLTLALWLDLGLNDSPRLSLTIHSRVSTIWR